MNFPMRVYRFSETGNSSRIASSNDVFDCLRCLAPLFIAISLLFIPASVLAQTQIGADIDGKAAYDESGRPVSLSADGNRLAIGASGNDDNGLDSGHVRVYRWSGTAWVQLGPDINGQAPYDFFGSSIALSLNGNRLAIGAPGNDENGFDAGHVRVYEWSGTHWSRLGGDINGEAAYDFSGRSVSLSTDGNRLAVGAPGNDANGLDAGQVRVFQWSGTRWVQMGPDISGEVFGDESGHSVSLSSDAKQLAIGAPKNDANGIDSGHVRVFQWSGNSWTQLGGDIDGEAFGDESGWSVALSSSGSRLAVGAPKNDGNGIDAGHTRIYQWSGAVWIQLGDDIDGEAFGDESGISVSLSADARYLVIGAHKNNDSGLDAGQGREFRWLDGEWTQLGSDIEGEAFGDMAGGSVSISSDANRIAIGAPLNINSSGTNAGHVRVFDVSVFNNFRINAGLNDAWFYPETSGQGFFINVYADLGVVSLAWFTYDTELPPDDATANLGDPGHRWMTAIGPLTGNRVLMNIEMTSGGLFDTPTEITRTDPPGSDGTIILTFYNCSSGSVEYDIPSINRKGVVPIWRVAKDNVVLCEALIAD